MPLYAREKGRDPVEKQKKAGIAGILRSKYARSFVKKYKWSYLLGMAALIYIDVLQTEVPIIVGGVIDGIKEGIFVESAVWGQVSRMLFIAAAVFLGRNIWRHCIFGASRKVERDMRNDLYAHLQTMPASYFQEHKAGEMMAYMTNDIEAVRMVFAVTVMMGLDCLTIGLSTIYNLKIFKPCNNISFTRNKINHNFTSYCRNTVIKSEKVIFFV
jgi:ATP-binding cassette subfamily B protein